MPENVTTTAGCQQPETLERPLQRHDAGLRLRHLSGSPDSSCVTRREIILVSCGQLPSGKRAIENQKTSHIPKTNPRLSLPHLAAAVTAVSTTFCAAGVCTGGTTQRPLSSFPFLQISLFRARTVTCNKKASKNAYASKTAKRTTPAFAGFLLSACYHAPPQCDKASGEVV